MFIGHYGLAMASKKMDSSIKLGTAIIAAQFLDLLWPVLVLMGFENFSIEPGNTKFTPLNFEHYPYSHSLTGSLLLAILFAIVYNLIKKDFKTSLLYGVLVFSHWILDFLTHRPDLALFFNDEVKVGLGLWNYPVISVLIESFVFIMGIYLFLKSSGVLTKKGKIYFWILVSLLAIFYIINMVSPPPPDVNAVTYSALLLWLFVILGYLVDINRRKLS